MLTLKERLRRRNDDLSRTACHEIERLETLLAICAEHASRGTAYDCQALEAHLKRHGVSASTSSLASAR